MMNLIDQINNHKYLYVNEISEPKDNSFRFVIKQASLGEQETDVKVDSSVVTQLNSIVSDQNCFIYEVVFKSYIAYSVINESYAQQDETEKFTGHLFRVYSESHFLNFVRASTIASEDYPGVFAHYGIVALNHIVDIVSTDLSNIKILHFPTS
jgi:hypothetical protein